MANYTHEMNWSALPELNENVLAYRYESRKMSKGYCL